MNLVACIYNSNHLVKPSRKQIHEMKCPDRFKKQNEFKLCPYNPNHNIKKELYEKHILECPNRPKISYEEEQNIERSKKMNDIATEQEQIQMIRMKLYKDCEQEKEIPGISKENMKKNKEKREKILKKKFKEITESEGRYIAEIADKNDIDQINDNENKHEIDNFEGDLDFDLENENKGGKEVFFYRYNPNDEDKDINEYSANIIDPNEIKRILKGK